MDAHEQLAFDSEVCAAVLGRAGDFILVRVDSGRVLEDAVIQDAYKRGFGYCGTLGLVGGVPRAQCESDPDSVYTCLLATLEFARLVCDRLKPPPAEVGDAVDWIKQLHELPDTRDERQQQIAARIRRLSAAQ